LTALGDAHASIIRPVRTTAAALTAFAVACGTATAAPPSKSSMVAAMPGKILLQAADAPPWTPPLPPRKPEPPAAAEAPVLAPETPPPMVEVAAAPWDRVPLPPALPPARRPEAPQPVEAEPSPATPELPLVTERPVPEVEEPPTPPEGGVPPPPDLGETPGTPPPPEGTAPAAPAPQPPSEAPTVTAEAPEQPGILTERPPQPAGPAPEIVVPPPRRTGEAAAETFRITFEGTEATLDAAHDDVLETVVGRLQDDPSLRLQLLSYAGGSPESASVARTLSLDRALAVRSFLIEQDIRRTRIDVRALGDTAPDGPADRIDLVLVP